MRLIRSFLGAALLLAALVPDAAAESPPGLTCAGIAPACHLGQHAACICTGVSRTTCRWECVASP